VTFERLAPDEEEEEEEEENKRSPSKKEWSAPQGRATTF